MRRETFLMALRGLNSARPFRPFTVELVTGVRLVAHHPEAIVVQDDLGVCVERDRTTHFFDASSVVRVVDLVVPPGATG